MKVALTVWGERISPLYDAAQKILVAKIDDNGICGMQYEPFHHELPIERAVRLCDLQVGILICGAISEISANMLNAYGIELIPFIAGKVDKILNAYVSGRLTEPGFKMPGCRMRKRGNKNIITEKEAVMPPGKGKGKGGGGGCPSKGRQKGQGGGRGQGQGRGGACRKGGGRGNAGGGGQNKGSR